MDILTYLRFPMWVCVFGTMCCVAGEYQGDMDQSESDEIVSDGSGVYQAESAQQKSGCSVETNHEGFSGSGFVEFGGNGTWIEWNNINADSDGDYTLTFRYAVAAGSHQFAVVINGENAGNIPFASTGAWSTWETVSITKALKAGSNVIRVQANSSSGGLNLDKMDVTDDEDTDDEDTDDTNNNDDWKLVWSDEFISDGLPDGSKWAFDVGGDGWGNNEYQYYTENRTENARVENGKLVIEARKENYENNNYTSARLVSKGKGDWLYGRFVVSAKLPWGVGTWPAIWMLSTDWSYGVWPDSGEIDIMEHVGYDQNLVHSSVHTKAYHHSIGTQQTASEYVDGVSDGFHEYEIQWFPDHIDAFIDGVKYFTFDNENSGYETWPFDKRFHLILNIAVGGTWGAAEGFDENIWPQKMEIDYVRVYQK